MQYDRKLFGQRTAYDVVILLDWKTVPQSFVTSKIQIMHEILTKVCLCLNYILFISELSFSSGNLKLPTNTSP